jgi:outer membrane protein OmpU
MKKILLATTLLAATTGFAAAEVAVSGTARMGVVYDGVDAFFSSRVRIKFVASGETDGGLTFGAEVRNDQSGVGNAANGDSTVFISGEFGKLTMGDTGNAVDSLLGQVSGVGYTGLGDLNEIGFIGRVVTGAQYEYSTGNLTFALGLGQTVPAALTGLNVDEGGDGFYSVAVKYAAGDYSVGLGYESVDDSVADLVAAADVPDSQITLAGSATFGAATVKAKVVDRESAADVAIAVSLDYKIDALTVTAFATDNVDFAGTDTYGLGASYDLGGGANVVGGVVDNGTDTIADLGVTMAF